jgi:hypothetical protein
VVNSKDDIDKQLLMTAGYETKVKVEIKVDEINSSRRRSLVIMPTNSL